VIFKGDIILGTTQNGVQYLYYVFRGTIPFCGRHLKQEMLEDIV